MKKLIILIPIFLSLNCLSADWGIGGCHYKITMFSGGKEVRVYYCVNPVPTSTGLTFQDATTKLQITIHGDFVIEAKW